MREFDLAIELSPNDAQAYAARANAWLNERGFDRAIEDYDQAIRLKPESAAYFTGRGFAWHLKGIGVTDRSKCEERALSDYAEAIRLDPEFAFAINNRAWILATCPIDRFRDGNLAVEEATRACELTGWSNAGHIDTLSVSYAEAGDFEQAIRWEETALEDPAYEREDGETAREKLVLYSQRKPYRE